MLDDSIADKRGNLVERYQPHANIFMLIEGSRFRLRDVQRKKRRADIPEECRIRLAHADAMYRCGIEPCFLIHLAPGSVERGFSIIDDAAGNFQRDRFRTVTILFDHHDLAVTRQGNDVHPIVALENVEIMRAIAALLHLLDDVEDAAIRNNCFFPCFPDQLGITLHAVDGSTVCISIECQRGCEKDGAYAEHDARAVENFHAKENQFSSRNALIDRWLVEFRIRERERFFDALRKEPRGK